MAPKHKQDDESTRTYTENQISALENKVESRIASIDIETISSRVIEKITSKMFLAILGVGLAIASGLITIGISWYKIETYGPRLDKSEESIQKVQSDNRLLDQKLSTIENNLKELNGDIKSIKDDLQNIKIIIQSKDSRISMKVDK